MWLLMLSSFFCFLFCRILFCLSSLFSLSALSSLRFCRFFSLNLFRSFFLCDGGNSFAVNGSVVGGSRGLLLSFAFSRWCLFDERFFLSLFLILILFILLSFLIVTVIVSIFFIFISFSFKQTLFGLTFSVRCFSSKEFHITKVSSTSSNS